MSSHASNRPVSPDLTEIAVVLDRSGSMMSLEDDMEGGLWATITEQHGQPGRCRVSLYQFDDVWEPVWEAKPSGAITADDCRLVPRGSTALHDAVVKSLAADPQGFDDGAQMAQSRSKASVAAYSKSGVRAMHSATSAALSDYRAGRTKKVDLDKPQ